MVLCGDELDLSIFVVITDWLIFALGISYERKIKRENINSIPISVDSVSVSKTNKAS